MSKKSQNKLKLQIVSDLHLEFRKNDLTFLVPSAPILCLLGDICVLGDASDFDTYAKFIDVIHDKYDYIIHLTGNHEYYNKYSHYTPATLSMDMIDKKLYEFSKKYKKLHILNNNIFRITWNSQKYILVGTTLWTFIDKENCGAIQKYMNDYKYIFVENEKKGPDDKPMRHYTPEDMIIKHQRAVKFIKTAITKAKNEGAYVVLLTHHKSFKEKKDKFSQAYEADLQSLYNLPVILAAYGHTHQAKDIMINNVRVVSNPRGYPSQKTRFDPKLTFTV